MSQQTLAEYQVLVNKLVKDRGFDKETIPEVFILLAEEVGELARAIRKSNGQKIDRSRRQHDVEEELADVFFMLIDLSNRLGVDLAQAFADKEKINQKRSWSV